VIRLLQRLLDPAYLYALNPGPLGRWGTVYVAWAILLLIGFWVAWQWNRRTPCRAARVSAWACGAGLVMLGARFWSAQLGSGWGGASLSAEARYLLLEAWTARVWPISATLVALLAPAIDALSRLRLPALLQRQVDALVAGPWSRVSGQRSADGVQISPGVPLWEHACLTGVHLAGLAALWYLAGRPLWWSVPALLSLSILPLLARPRRLRLETLAPLLPAYLAAAAHLSLAHWLHVDIDEYQGFALLDLWSPWFNVLALVVGGTVYALWIQLRLVARGLPLPGRWGQRIAEAGLPVVLGLLLALWLGCTVAIHRTRGVTASDPYCYTQMAIDLAQTGSPLHDFPLAGLARDLGVPTWPTVHIGYHPPVSGNRSPTMWPIGWPALMVPFFWVGGLPALYLAAPLMSGLALLAVWALANEACFSDPNHGPAKRGRVGPQNESARQIVLRSTRWAIAALTCWLVATSPEGSERMLVPMADAAAQLLSVLTLWLVLRGLRRGYSALYGALAGASLGLAYLVRHPQLPLGIVVLAAFWLPQGHRQAWTSWRLWGTAMARAVAFVVVFGLTALAVAAPDLWYHRQAFGGWLHTESSEWFLISVDNISRSFFVVLQQGLLRRQELGFLAPFAICGAWLLWRRHRRPAVVLALGVGAAFVFHLCYSALRPRDLIALVPMVYLCAAYGFVAAWQWAERRGTLGAAMLSVGSMVLLFARSEQVLAMPWSDDVITFGHVRASQYHAFVALGEITPQNAVIGSMLNGGGIELHAGRQAVHPAPWTEEELYRWTDALLSRGQPFYVLDDGEEMPAVLARLSQRYRLRPIQALDLPYFAVGGGNLPRQASLYEVVSPSRREMPE